MDFREHNVADAADKTFEWLDTHPSYKQWLQSKSSLLWIKGKPGAGKSTLLKYALYQENREHAIIASFFFNGRGTPLEKSPFGLYRAILHQLLLFASDNLSKLAIIFDERNQTIGDIEEKWHWQERELQNHMSDLLLSLANHPIRLYIDALDECGEENAGQLVEYFKILVDKAVNAGKSLNICFSCRHYPIIALEGLSVSLEDENGDDIKLYVQQKLREQSIEQNHVYILAKNILDRANGVFQWVALVLPGVIKDYKRRVRMEKIQSNIKKLPPTLNELYHTLLMDISDDERPLSLSLLRWICFALRPLSPAELRHALILGLNGTYSTLEDCMKDDDYVADDEAITARVTDLSKGLAEVRVSRMDEAMDEEIDLASQEATDGEDEAEDEVEDRYVVQFVHESVKEYLLQGGFRSLEPNDRGSVISRSNLRLALTCIHYLTLGETSRAIEEMGGLLIVLLYRHQWKTQNHPRSMKLFPLMSYAISSWAEHAREADGDIELQKDLYQSLFEIGKYSTARIELTTTVHLLAATGLAEVLRLFLKLNDTRVDTLNSENCTPLHRAAMFGRKSVVQILIERDDVDVNEKNFHGKSALSIAAALGNDFIVKLLLDHDDINIESQDLHSFTPLIEAAAWGYEKVVKLLLNHDDININSQNDNGATPLIEAVTKGHEKVVELLLEREDIDVNLRDVSGNTALSKAVHYGYKVIVEMLLEHEDIDRIWTRNSETLLSLAESMGHEKIVELLKTHSLRQKS
jgi:ankyrin repeat protein